VHIPFSEYDLGWGPSDFDGFQDFVGAVCGNCGSSVDLGAGLTRVRKTYNEGPIVILTIGGPGRIVFRLTGVLTSQPLSVWKPQGSRCGGCAWFFKGKISIDEDDFDPPYSSGRGPWANLITITMWYLHNFDGYGHDFQVFFDGSRSVQASGQCQ
jgi:hypothetical protein